MASGARSGCGFFLAAAILAAAVIGVAEGKAKLRTGKIQHVTRGAGAAEWWDAVTGKDEHGDLVTTFMHKRWGTALQLYHSEANSFLPFRFVPHLNWLTRSESGHAQGVVVTGEEVETVNYWSVVPALNSRILARRRLPALLLPASPLAFPSRNVPSPLPSPFHGHCDRYPPLDVLCLTSAAGMLPCTSRS